MMIFLFATAGWHFRADLWKCSFFSLSNAQKACSTTYGRFGNPAQFSTQAVTWCKILKEILQSNPDHHAEDQP